MVPHQNGSLFWLSIDFRPRRINGMFSGVRHIISLMALTVKILPAMKRLEFNLWIGKITWRRKWQPTPVFLPG